MLRLNPKEVEHEELLRLLQRSIDEQNKALANKSNSADTIKAIDVATKYARPLIKAEWKRVKDGELPFRIARNWVAPIIFLLCISAIVFIWNGTFVC